jgi:hypothetical protein
MDYDETSLDLRDLEDNIEDSKWNMNGMQDFGETILGFMDLE